MADSTPVIIIGSGPIGLAAGIELKRRDIPFLIIEKGCLANSIFNYPTNMTFFSTSDRLEIGGVPFISHGDKPTRREALEYYKRVVTSFELPAKLYETVESITGDDGNFTVTTDKDTYKASKVVIATGFYNVPKYMNVPGEDLPKVKHYYDEPHLYALQKVLVVGAANSAVDAALETFRSGAEVSMVVRDEKIDNRVKYWKKPDIENRIKEQSITAYFNSEVAEIRPDEVDIKTPDGVVTIENDFVLAMTGYKPNYRLFNKIDIDLTEDEYKMPVYNEETQETSRNGVYVAGVICGGLDTNRWFIENARDHAYKLADHIEKELNPKTVIA